MTTTHTFESYWHTVLGAGTPASVVREFDLDTKDGRGLDEWLGVAEVEAWRVGGLGGDPPAAWADHHQTALAKLAAVQS